MEPVIPKFRCKLCPADPFESDDFAAVAKHTRQLHSQLPADGGRFVCCMLDCSVARKQFVQWQAHVKRCAERLSRKPTDRVVETTIFPCSSLENCSEKFVLVHTLMGHLREHLKTGQPIVCPFQNCLERIDSVRTFHRHNANLHRNETPAGRIVVNVGCADADDGTNDGGVPRGEENPDFSDEEEGLNQHDVDMDINGEAELPPVWFVNRSAAESTVETDCSALCLSANVLFNVPKSKVRPLFQLVDNLTSRWLPQACDIRDILRQHCDPLIVNELASQIMDRVTTQLPLRHTYDRSVGPSSLVTDYRLRKEMVSSMCYVPPVDVHAAISSDPNFDDECPIMEKGG